MQHPGFLPAVHAYNDDDDDDDDDERLNENSPEGGTQETEIQHHPARETHLAVNTHQVC